MNKHAINPAVDFYFNKTGKWQETIKHLRAVVLDCGLTETLKWGCPCYTSDDSNIVLIHVFKEYCALLFFQGALLTDPGKTLIQQTAHVQAARQLRFTDAGEVAAKEPSITRFIREAIKNNKAGVKVQLKKTVAFSVPAEFQDQLSKNAPLKKAFASLTPGRQRAYLLYFAAPKQATTRESRIGKSIPFILKGKGLND